MKGLFGHLERVDMGLLRAMRTRGHCACAERTAKGLAKAGEHGAVWLGLGGAAALADTARRSQWIAAGLIGPAAVGVNYAVKLATRRPRPTLEDLPPLGGAPSSLSFPSAHATASFASANVMARIDARAAGPAFGLAIAIAVTRPYLGMHYPSDVLAGAFFGTIIGRFVPLPGPGGTSMPGGSST